ncbi:MAG: hypothetical protein P1V18_03055 [Candidatus Gracilibacteria bacterium]|nr:hypothetical protein [Candidatus Gracilibacteria bacterium]
MNKFTRLISVLAISFSMLASMAFAQPIEVVNAQLELTQEQQSYNWNPLQGDWIIVNVERNTLQFVREDNSKTSAPIDIGSGKMGGPINYLGMNYVPATPEDVWEVQSLHQQNWFNVFGSQESDEQLFMRLYRVRGEERIYSHYGIHTVPNIDELLDTNDGFNSWGCVLTKYQTLKFLEYIYSLNGGVLKVVTTKQNTSDVLNLVNNF